MKTKVLIASLLLLSGVLMAQTDMAIQSVAPTTPKTDLMKGKNVTIAATLGDRFVARATDVKGNTTLVILAKDLSCDYLPLSNDYQKATSDYLCAMGDKHLVCITNKGVAELRLLDKNGDLDKQVILGNAVIKVYPFYTDADSPILLVQYKKNYEFVKINKAQVIVARALAPKDFSFRAIQTQWESDGMLCTAYINERNYSSYCALNLSNLEVVGNTSISKSGSVNRVYNYPSSNFATIDIYPNAAEKTFAVVERYVKNFPAVCVRIYDNSGNVLQEQEVIQPKGEKIAKGVTRDYLIYEDVQVLPDHRVVISKLLRPATTTFSGFTGTREFGKTSLTFYVLSKNAVETIDMGEIGSYDLYPFFLLAFDDNEAKLLAFEEGGYHLMTCNLKTKNVTTQVTSTDGDYIAHFKVNNEYLPTINTIYNKYEMPWGYVIDVVACQGLTMFRDDQSANIQNATIFVSKDLKNITYYTALLTGMRDCDFNHLLTDDSNAEYAIFHRFFYAEGKRCNQFVAIDKRGELNIKEIKGGIPFRISDKEFYLLNDLPVQGNPQTEFSLDKLTVK